MPLRNKHIRDDDKISAVRVELATTAIDIMRGAYRFIRINIILSLLYAPGALVAWIIGAEIGKGIAYNIVVVLILFGLAIFGMDGLRKQDGRSLYWPDGAVTLDGLDDDD